MLVAHGPTLMGGLVGSPCPPRPVPGLWDPFSAGEIPLTPGSTGILPPVAALGAGRGGGAGRSSCRAAPTPTPGLHP